MMSFQSRIIALAIGILLLVLIYNLIRRKHLDNFYSILWIFVGVFFLIIAAIPEIVNILSSLLGISFVPLALLAIAIVALGTIILHLSIITTKHNQKIKEFEKKIAYLSKNNPK